MKSGVTQRHPGNGQRCSNSSSLSVGHDSSCTQTTGLPAKSVRNSCGLQSVVAQTNVQEQIREEFHSPVNCDSLCDLPSDFSNTQMPVFRCSSSISSCVAASEDVECSSLRQSGLELDAIAQQPQVIESVSTTEDEAGSGRSQHDEILQYSLEKSNCGLPEKPQKDNSKHFSALEGLTSVSDSSAPMCGKNCHTCMCETCGILLSSCTCESFGKKDYSENNTNSCYWKTSEGLSMSERRENGETNYSCSNDRLLEHRNSCTEAWLGFSDSDSHKDGECDIQSRRFLESEITAHDKLEVDNEVEYSLSHCTDAENNQERFSPCDPHGTESVCVVTETENYMSSCPGQTSSESAVQVIILGQGPSGATPDDDDGDDDESLCIDWNQVPARTLSPTSIQTLASLDEEKIVLTTNNLCKDFHGFGDLIGLRHDEMQ